MVRSSFDGSAAAAAAAAAGSTTTNIMYFVASGDHHSLGYPPAGVGSYDDIVVGHRTGRPEPVAELRAALATLLRRAQRAGGVRDDLDAGSLDAVIAAAHALKVHPSGGDHLVELLWAVLRPPPPDAEQA